MREAKFRAIKFRAWDKRRKIMLFPFTLWDLHDDGQELEHGSGSIFVNRKYNLFEKDDFIFMQFTGLEDKNGLDIYVGDVIKSYKKNYYGKFDVDDYVIDNIHYFFELKGLRENEYGEDYGDVKIIGNIYSNPELKEVK